MERTEDRQIQALITLLGDDDDRVRGVARRRLREMGGRTIPFLEYAAERGDPATRLRTRTLLEEFSAASLEEEFRRMASPPAGGIDLEEAVFLLARFGYPRLDVRIYAGILDIMGMELRARLAGACRGRESLIVLTRYLFQEQGYRGNRRDYYDPDNSYLNRVIERRRGIPISLSVLCLLLARRVGLPLEGIGMPGHFILRARGEDPPLFIDPFNGGALLTREDCRRFLEQAGFSFKEDYLQPARPREILARMIRNLELIYAQRGDETRVDRLTRLFEALYQER